MSGSDKYIKKRKGRTTLYYQRAVPKAMQGKYGKVIQESLGTSDLRAARHKRDELTVEWNRAFAVGEQQTKRTDIRSKATLVIERLRSTLEYILEDNSWPDAAVAEASPWIDMAEQVLHHADKLPVDIQQNVYQLTRAIEQFHSDPITFDREQAAKLVSTAVTKRSMAELCDLYLQSKKDAGIIEKSLKSQRARLQVLEDHEWLAEDVLALLKAQGRAAKTIENWMTGYETFARYLLNEHKVDLSVPKVRTTKYSQTRDTFTADELQAIFKHPIDETMKWIGLVSLHQGFRAGEVLQLGYEDVRQHHEVWVFDIHDRDTGKRVKTRSTVRKVPVHPWLIDNGFLEYWEDNKGWAKSWKSYDGSPSQGFSKVANRMILQALGLKTSDTPTGKKVFHSLRHTFRDFSREAGLQEFLIDRIGGWSTTKYGEGAGYGQGHSMKAMYEQLEQVKFMD